MKVLILFFSFFIAISWGDTIPLVKPSFDWGAGILAIYGNHYRGSNQAKLWLFPMPYFSYTSERLEANPSSIRGVLYKNERLSFKLSFMPGLRVQSKDNLARQGMNSLDYTAEVGPMVIVKMWQSRDEEFLLNFEWPLRQSFAIDFSFIKSVGFFTVPFLNLIYKPIQKNRSGQFEFSISPMFADKNYHQYFYGVDQKYSSVDRPAYSAKGGYSGFQSAILANIKSKDFAIINFFRWDVLNKAAFVESPLVKNKSYLICGFSLFWMIK